MKKFFSLIVMSSLFIYVMGQTDSIARTETIGEVVIAASKYENLSMNAAQQTYVISSTALRQLNAQTSADALSMSGQVFVQRSQQGGGSPMLRGFEASRVLLVVDGVRMNNILYRAGHLQNIVTVDNNAIERIEVLYGPSSTVYGSDALGGVVHFRTIKPALATDKFFSSKGGAFFRYGTVNNELTGHAHFSLAGKKFGSVTSVTFSRFGDLRMGNYVAPATAGYWERNYYADVVKLYDTLGNVVQHKDTAIANKANNVLVGSGYYQYDILQKFLYKQTENITHTLNIQFSNSSNVPRYDRLDVYNNNTILRDAEWYYGPQRRLLAVYQFEAKHVGWFDDIDANISYQNIQESRHNRGFNRTFRTSRIENVHVIGLDFDFRKIIRNHEVALGVEGQFNILKSTAYATDINADTTRPADTRYPDGKNNMNNIAVYVTHLWTVSPKVIIQEGIRYNFINLHSTFTDQSQDFYPLPYNEIKNMYHAVSGNLGVVAKPGRGFRIAALFSTGFRAPNVHDMAKVFESVPGSVVVPNNKLKPEYTINGELTLEKDFLNKLKLGITGFGTYFINAITLDKDKFNGNDSIVYDGTFSRVLSAQNKGRAYVTGVSARVEYKPIQYVSFNGAVTYTYGRIITDTVPYPLDHIAPVYGRVGVSGNYKWFNAEFFTLFSGKKKVKDYNMLGEDNFGQATPDGAPSWYTLNLRFGFQPVKYMRIDLGCDNLLDMRYRPFASGISGPGRNLFAKLSFNW